MIIQGQVDDVSDGFLLNCEAGKYEDSYWNFHYISWTFQEIGTW